MINEMASRGLRCALPVTACKIRGKLSTFPYWNHMEDCGMGLFVGLDVSLAKTAICGISEHGRILKEARVASEPEELLRWAPNCCAGPQNRRE